MSDKLNKIVEQVAELSVMEVADLVKELEEKFGVTAVVAAAAVPLSGTTEEPKEQQTSFDVILLGYRSKQNRCH